MARRRRSGSVGERFRSGDEAALAEVFDEYSGPMMAVASHMLSDRRLAEEAVQQAFVQAWRAASTFEADRPLGPWLRSIVRRTAVDVWRKERRHQARSFDEVPPGDLPSVEAPSIAAASDVWAVRQAVDALPPASREVIRLAHMEHLTQPEIATRLDVPLGTVKSRTHTAYRQLAAALSADYEMS
ncbi:MAG TPA: RNA polymerase sigma factor [Acidimicrobiales bacterium]|jgi:RNA polymerase sigma-70 factor (ECF subfamily)|nr:RNA polymerase sigma factor [Acidimicrobiales bacterium]